MREHSMEHTTDTKGALRPHIDDLCVVHGHAIVVHPIESRPLGVRRDEGEAEPSPWLYLPAGRGE